MKKIEIDTFLKFQFVSNPSFSPDGKYIAFVVSNADRAENTYKANLYVYDMAEKKVRKMTSGGDAKSYVWTNDNTLLFPAARCSEVKKKQEAGEALTSFYEISPEGGEACHAFTVPAKIIGFKALPDGRFLMTASQDNHKDTRKKSYEVFDELPFWGNGLGYTNAKRNRFAVYNRENGELSYVACDWTDCTQSSVLGDLLLYKAYPWKQNVRGLNEGIYLYNLKTGETKTLLEPDTMHTGTIELLNENEALVAAIDSDYRYTNKYNSFYKMNLADGSMNLFVPYDASIASGSVGSDARYGSGRGQKLLNGDFYFISTVDDFAWLRKLDKDGNIYDCLTMGWSCDRFDVNGEHLVSCVLQGTKIAELYLVGEQITHFNDFVGEEYSVVTPEAFSFTASDGYEIHGWVMKPADYEEGVSYPAIFHIHGGPRTVFSDVFHHEMQMWANAGYFVFYCNPRGSDGRGTDFGNINGIYGTVDYQNLMDFTDEVLKRYPQIDTARVGVTGGSYGGFMTNWIVGHTDRFKAAASQRSISNWVSFEHNSDIGHTFIVNNQGANTRENVELLWKQSPLQYAPNCKTPILFIHSDEDYRCYMAEGLAMYSAVMRNGCPSRLCLFHGENHELSRGGKPENRIDRMTEILNWMDQYLK